MWIARDKDGELYLYSDKPTVNEYGYWVCDDKAPTYFSFRQHYNTKIEKQFFPEVTFENSPKEFVIKDETTTTD